MALLNKITNIIGAVLGIIQTALPIIKEAIATVTRVCGLVFFWTNKDEKILVKINKIYDKIYNGYEKFKNLWIAMGKKK